MSEKVGKIWDHCAQVFMQMVDPSEPEHHSWCPQKVQKYESLEEYGNLACDLNTFLIAKGSNPLNSLRST